MGHDVDGILFYGIFLDEDPPHPWDDEGIDWEEYYARQKGLAAPKFKGEYTDREAYRAYGQQELTPYLEKKRALLKEAGCIMGWHGETDNLGAYVAVTACHHEGGKPVKEIESLDVPQDADDKLKAFCEVMGLKRKFTWPKWWLTGSYG